MTLGKVGVCPPYYFGSWRAGRFFSRDQLGIIHRLGERPIGDAVIEHLLQIALRRWGEAVFSPAARLCGG